MSDVPTELYHEILLRVPADQIRRCRSVCKQWQSIIDSPDFTSLHLQSQLGDEDLLMVKGTDGGLYSMSLSSLNRSEGSRTVEGLEICQSTRVSFRFPAPSCHGFTIIWNVQGTIGWALWNPFTGYWLEVKHCKDFGTNDHEAFQIGLDYDDSTNDYKVVRVSNVADDSCTSGPFLLKTIIYSVKSNKWRRINDLHNCYMFYQPNAGLYFNGSLYWTVYEEQLRKCIVSLDLNTETYHKLPLPSAASEASDFELNALSGCLILFCHDPVISCFNVWIMKDDNRWSKLITFEDKFITFEGSHRPGRGQSFEIRALAYMENKKQLVIQSCKKFFWFDLNTKIGKIFSIRGVGDQTLMGGVVSSQVFPASLVRLKANASKGMGKRKRKSKGMGKRKRKSKRNGEEEEEEKLDLTGEFRTSYSRNFGLTIH